MVDILIAIGLLVMGLTIERMQTRPRWEWSDPLNIVWLSLILAGGLLLAIRVPRRDVIGEKKTVSSQPWIAAWPRYLAGLWLLDQRLRRYEAVHRLRSVQRAPALGVDRIEDRPSGRRPARPVLRHGGCDCLRQLDGDCLRGAESDGRPMLLILLTAAIAASFLPVLQ